MTNKRTAFNLTKQQREQLMQHCDSRAEQIVTNVSEFVEYRFYDRTVVLFQQFTLNDLSNAVALLRRVSLDLYNGLMQPKATAKAIAKFFASEQFYELGCNAKGLDISKLVGEQLNDLLQQITKHYE